MKSKSFKLLVLSAITGASVAFATPPNTGTVDGQALEYDAADLRSTFTFPVGGSPGDAPNFGSDNVLTNLYVTWTTNALTVALNGTIGQFDSPPNKVAVLIDVDPGNGTGTRTTTNWLIGPGHIVYNDVGWKVSDDPSATDFDLDFMLASEGSSHNIIKVIYTGDQAPETNGADVVSLVDTYNGVSTPGVQITADIKKIDATHPLNALEAVIPWSVIYGSDTSRLGTVQAGEIVPQGATLRMFAIIHNNSPSTPYSSTAVIPDQTSVLSGYSAGIFTSDDYVDVVIDADTNGIPDVGVGDLNAPFLKYVSGVQGKRQVFAWFNENVTAGTAGSAANWMVAGETPDSVSVVQSDAVLLNLTNDLPANGTFVRVEAAGVEDADGNDKTTFNFFNPAASGIETSITVRFLLNKNSGLGFSSANPRATTNLFVNGGSAPLEWGYPPAKSSPLVMLNSTQYYRDVTFPPGTSAKLFYKYSGVLDGGGQATGTNNYEAIRLVNYTDASRQLTLPTNGITSLVVTDWLGAAAAPYRDPNTNSGYNALYIDARRGDAGVRRRTTMTFQLDLSQRNRSGISRVMVQGSDPLRGFNADNVGISDFAGNGYVGWDVGGVELVDNGTLGDTNANDGIYARRWAFTIDGLDTVVEPNMPNSLVGGAFDTLPFNGGWVDGRSPRSFIYKFYVYKASTAEAFESPSSNIEVYLEDPVPTNVVLAPFLWDNASLPLPPPSNAPTMITVSNLSGVGYAQFENEVTELQHGFIISTNPLYGWNDYGSRAVTTAVAGVWQVRTDGAGTAEHYAAFSGPPKPSTPWYWEPNPLPSTGGVVRYWYNQHSRGFAGARNIGVAGSINTWGDALPASFAGDGWWYYDIVLGTNDPVITAFKTRRATGEYEGGDNNYVSRGFVRASWTPLQPTNGELFTITYDAFGGTLSAATNINVYTGFGENWSLAADRQMTNVLGQTNVWEITFEVPTNITTSVNFVFNNRPGGTWDSKDSPGGLNWRVFLGQ